MSPPGVEWFRESTVCGRAAAQTPARRTLFPPSLPQPLQNAPSKTKVWSLGQPTPNFTLEGHEKGVNCVDYFTGGDRWGGGAGL